MKTFASAVLASLIFSSVVIAQKTGIGILNPTRGKLEVQGAVGSTVAIFGGDGQGVSVQRSNPAIGFNHYFDGTTDRYISNGYGAVQWYNAGLGIMYYDLFGNGAANAAGTGRVTAMNISRTGNAGIGISPLINSRLTVARGTGIDGTAIFRGSVYASHINYSTAENTYIRGGKAGSYVYLNDISGGEVIMGNPVATATSLVKVGINNNNPQLALEVRQASGRGLIMIANSNFANWHLKVGPTLAPGAYQLLYFNESVNAIGAYHPQTGAYAALSDERVKTAIKPMTHVGEQLLQLKPVQYKINLPQAGPELHKGFIAQDLAKIFPSLVTRQEEPVPGDPIPDMHSVNYEGMAVYAIKIIQEQQKKIAELRQRLKALKQTN